MKLSEILETMPFDKGNHGVYCIKFTQELHVTIEQIKCASSIEELVLDLLERVQNNFLYHHMRMMNKVAREGIENDLT